MLYAPEKSRNTGFFFVLAKMFLFFQAIISRKDRGAMCRKVRKVTKVLCNKTSLRTLHTKNLVNF